MKTVGIIVEYNPLHNGHVYHFEQSKKLSGADAVIAVMSGNFLQRGEPAIVDKWARAEMALHMGVDLVIELPAAFSSQPAEWFAFGAISALDATGIVDAICFGSESGEIDWLHVLAEKLHTEPEQFRDQLKQHLANGEPYPQAYSRAAADWTIDLNAAFHFNHSPEWYLKQLTQPNNTLGLHYLMALKRLNSEIRPMTVLRKKAGYHDTSITDQAIASATALRNQLINEKRELSAIKRYIPDYTYSILQREVANGKAPMDWERFAAPLFHQLLVSSENDLRQIFEVTEGLEYRIKEQLNALWDRGNVSIDHFLDLLKTKRYTRTKLQRTLTRILLQHKKEMLNLKTLQQGVPYLRILGMSQTGRQLLRKMKKTARVPVVIKTARHHSALLTMDIRAAQAYTAAFPESSASSLTREFTQSPLVFGGSPAK